MPYSGTRCHRHDAEEGLSGSVTAPRQARHAASHVDAGC
jgi:hypothetical protein